MSVLFATFIEGAWQTGTSIADRGLEFGDGLFETIRMTHELEIPLWPFHKKRLSEGLVKLNFPINSLQKISDSIPALAVNKDVIALANHAGKQFRNLQLKLIVSRQSNAAYGIHAARGYDFLPQQSVNIQLQLRFAPDWPDQPDQRVGLNPVRLSTQPRLAGIKHLNRLEQVMARQAFQPEWHESLMMNQAGDVVEACMSNIYVFENNKIITPILNECGVEGVARRWLFEQSTSSGFTVKEGDLSMRRIQKSDGLMLSNTLNGFTYVSHIDDFLFENRHITIIKEVQRRLQNQFMSLFNKERQKRL